MELEFTLRTMAQVRKSQTNLIIELHSFSTSCTMYAEKHSRLTPPGPVLIHTQCVHNALRSVSGMYHTHCIVYSKPSHNVITGFPGISIEMKDIPFLYQKYFFPDIMSVLIWLHCSIELDSFLTKILVIILHCTLNNLTRSLHYNWSSETTDTVHQPQVA